MNLDSTCGNCKHMYESEPDKELRRNRVCRRFPPTTQMLPIGVGGSPAPVGFYPPVTEKMTCGEWNPKNVLQVQ